MGSSPTNDLDALRARDEAAHTRALAWLLDPREGHGFSDAVTREFHRLVLGRAPEHLSEAVVSVEPSPHTRRLDILVRSDADCLIVENEVDADTWKEDQVSRQRAGSGALLPAFQPSRVVLEPLEDAGGQAREEGSRPQGVRTVRWADLVAVLQAAYDDVRRHRPEADGLPFLRTYIDLVERNVIGRWRGFDMHALDPHLIAAASRYLTCKPRLLEELGRFCEAVRGEVSDRAGWVSRVGSEVKWDDGVVLNALNYHPAETAGARSLCVSLCFWTSSTRPDHLELWLSADTWDSRLIDRWGSELSGAGHKQLFGARATFRTREGYSEVSELIPRECWHVGGITQSRRAVTYCRERLLHYLEVSSRAPVFPPPRIRNVRRPEGTSTAA